MTSFLTTLALANHQVGLIICRALHTLGPKTDDDLKCLLIPNYLATPPKGLDQWNNTMEALKRTRVLADSDSDLVLCEGLQNCSEVSHEEFAMEFMRGLTQANLETIRDGGVPDDLFMGIVWLLTLPSGYLVRKFDSNAQELDGPYRRLQTFGFREAIVRVDEWRPFRRWARGLGLMRQMDGTTDCVDISDFLMAWIRKTDIDGSMENFVVDLEYTLPLLSNDILSNWYVQFTENDTKFSNIGEQLAWALLRAEQQSIIHLENVDDARVGIFSLPVKPDGNERLVTHIRKVV
jgi:hypothetical protein